MFRLWAFWSRFWSWISGEILKLKFGQYFAANVWLRLRSWILVKIMNLGLVNILTLDLVKMLILKLILNRNSEIVICSRFVNRELWSCNMNSTLGSVVPLAMFNQSITKVAFLAIIILMKPFYISNWQFLYTTSIGDEILLISADLANLIKITWHCC